MQLRNPYWLLLLILIPLVLYLFQRRKHFGALRFPTLKHFARRGTSLRMLLLPLLPLLRISALGLLIFALARPQEGTEIRRDFSKGVAIMMAVDISETMLAMDFFIDNERVNRLDAVKHVFRSFVLGDDDQLPGRPNDEIGIVSFGGFAISRAPTTLDHTALDDLLQQVNIPKPIYDQHNRLLNREEFKTAIGDALALSVARLKESPAKSKVVILLSDGMNTAGDIAPTEAAKAAKEFGLKVYTIGIGHTGYAPMPGIDELGRPILKQRRVAFDGSTLKRIARETGGQYFHAEDLSGLSKIYTHIDALEKTDIESKIFMLFHELFPLYLMIALGLLLTEQLLAHTYLRRLP